MLKYLMYSELFGLRQVQRTPQLTPAPGTYIQQSDGAWVVKIYDKKTRHGSSFKWVPVHHSQLPPRLKTEALLLGVVP